MKTFVINEGYTSGMHVVEAYSWMEKDSFVIFFGPDGKERLFAIPTGAVHTIRRKTDD